MGKSMLYIAKDVESLFKLESNKSKLVSELLRQHYMKAPVGGVEVADIENPSLSDSENTDVETKKVSEPIPVTKRDESQISPLEVDGRIEEMPKEFIGGEPDGIKWN